MKRIFLNQGPVVACAAVIYYLSSMPQVAKIPLPYQLDKLAHAIVYGILAITAHRAFFHQKKFETMRRNAGLLAILFALLYGMTDEFHQQFVPGRFSSLMDIAADVAGAVIAVWFRNKRSDHTT